MPTFTVHEAKTNLSRLLEMAEAGEDVVIARRDVPAVRLVRVDQPKPKRVFGAYKTDYPFTEAFFDPLPEDELKLWNGEG
jgi:prevent-host-death family protein